MKNRSRIRVLLVSPYSSKTVGGIGTWSKIILDFSREQTEIDICFLNTVQGLPKRWSMKHRLTHYFVGFIDSLLIIVRLFWRMLISRPDVVHYTSSAASALYKDNLAIWIVKGVFHKRFVIHWHFGRIPAVFEEKGKEYNQFIKVCKNADISITIDARSQETLDNAGILSKYVPNPIPATLQREAEQLSLDNIIDARKKGEVLFVGHVLETKGIVELVQACLASERVERLIVVGPFFDENLKKRVTEIASQRLNGEWLIFAGEKNREEVWSYYKTCNLFCLPSYSEGFPYVILEAMAFACPIVATKVGAIPEMLSGDCGSLVDVRQVAQLNKAINDALTDLKRSNLMGLRAHSKVLSDFTINNVFVHYSAIWKMVLQ